MGDITFDDFSGGEYGRKGGRRAGAGSWTGLNVQRYLDGSLGPRAGLKSLAPTGIPSGTVKGLGWSPAAGTNNRCWFIIANVVYGFEAESVGSAVATYTGSLDITPGSPVEGADMVSSTGQRLTYISVDNDDLYKLNHSTQAVTKLTSDCGGRPICFYRDVLVAMDRTQGNRLRFSNVQDFDTWTTTDYIDVGDGWEVTGLFPQRDHLVISKQDGSLWVLTGNLEPDVPNVTLRKLVSSVTPSDGIHEPAHGVGVGDGLVWFIPTYRDHPAYFDGSRVRQFEHLSLGDFSTALDQMPASARVLRVQYPDEVAFISGEEGSLDDNTALLLKEGTWSRHQFDIDIQSWAATGPTGRILLCDSTGSSPAFYIWNTHLDRPAIAADTFSRVGDGSDTPLSAEFTLADVYFPEGREQMVRSVRVDFRKWDTGSATANNFSVTVSALGRFDQDGKGDSATQSWSEASASASVNGTDDSETFGFGDQGYGKGFRLEVSAIRGAAIQAIHVTTMPRDATPRP